MCRILYALNQTQMDSKLRAFMSHSESKRNGTQALDGYGLAGFNRATGKWSIYRSLLPPNKDPNRQLIREKMTTYPLVVGQLRNVIKDNPAKTLLENTHPFYYKNQLFLHNGHIGYLNSKLTAEQRQWLLDNILPELRAHIRGQTDTELVFYLFLSILQSSPLNKKTRGDKFDIMRDAIYQLFQRMNGKFERFVANFVYSSKEYSFVSHVMKNPTENDIRHNPMYLNHPANNKGLLFSSEPISKHYEPVRINTFFIINHATGEYQTHNVHFS